MTKRELASLIVERYREQHPEKDWKKELFSPLSSIMNIFGWAKTKEGYTFWQEQYFKMNEPLNSFLKKNLLTPKYKYFISLQTFL